MNDTTTIPAEAYGHTFTQGTETCSRCYQTRQQLEPELSKYWSEAGVCWGAELKEKEVIHAAASHDWHYAYTESSEVRKAGWRSYKRLCELAKTAGLRGQLIASLWQKVRGA